MAIADTITSMQTHTLNAYNTIGLSGLDLTGTNKNLQNLSSSIKNSFLEVMKDPDTLFTNLPKKSGSGANITLNDTANAPMRITLGASELTQEGTPTPSSPQDIHTISGSNTIKVEGKNLFNKNSPNIENGYLDAQGNVVSNNSYRVSDYIYIGNYSDIVISGNSGSGLVYCLYDENKGLIGANSFSGETFTRNVPSNAKYIRTTLSASVLNQYMVESGTTPSTYTPYTLETKDIDLKSKNLLDNNIYAFDSDTALTPIDTGIRAISTLSSTSPSTSAAAILVVCDIAPYIGQKITLSAHAKSSSTNKGFMYLRLCKANGDVTSDYGTQVTSSTLDGDLSKSYTIPSEIGEYHYIQVALYSTRDSAVVKNDYVDYTNLQLEVGDKTDYEPYYDYGECGSIGNYENIPIRTSGKNLFDIENGEQGAIDSSGNYVDNPWNWRAVNYISVKPSTTYTFSIDRTNISQSNYLRIYEYNSSKTFLSPRKESANRSDITFTTGSTTEYIKYVIYIDNTTMTKSLVESLLPQIENGSSRTPYEPYGNETWYLKSENEKAIYTGADSEGWSKSSTTAVDRYYIQTNRYLANNNSKCNYFIKGGVVDTVGIWANNVNQQLLFNFASSGTTNLSDWKTWLSTHNLIVWQPLATPIYTKITGTLANQLENVYKNMLSQNSQTNISQVNNDLSFNMLVQAIEE